MLLLLAWHVASSAALHVTGVPSPAPPELVLTARTSHLDDLLPLVLAAPAASQERDGVTDGYYDNLYRRFGISVGAGVLDNFDSTVQIDSGSLVGAILDMEDFLGIDESQSVVRLDSHYAFNRRHRVDLSIYDIGRDGTQVVGQDLQIGQVVIPAGEVETDFDTLIVKLAYRYNFVADLRTTIGASFGFHTMGIDLAFESNDFNAEESFDVTAPLPVVGLHAAYALSPKWSLSGSVEFFQIALSDFSGSLMDSRLTLEHDWFEHFGWGIGYNGFALDAELEDSPLSADIEYAYQGLIIYLRAYF